MEDDTFVSINEFVRIPEEQFRTGISGIYDNRSRVVFKSIFI